MSSSQDVAQLLLNDLNDKGTISNSIAYAAEKGIDHQDVIGAVKSLECDNYVSSTVASKTEWILTSEGKAVAANGSPEYNVYMHLKSIEGEVDMPTLEGTFSKEAIGIAMSNGMKQKMFQSRKEGKESAAMIFLKANPACTVASDAAKDMCLSVSSGKAGALNSKDLDAMKKRKLVAQETTKTFTITKGANFSTTRKKMETDITREMLQTGAWKQAAFKPYNLNANGLAPVAGALHPLMKVRQEYREIFLELGFQEMETSNFVESGFWNFDSLFVPQKHPARDLQDTFYLSQPAHSPQGPPKDYMERVKKAHEDGGDTGSTGYHCSWSEEESSKNCLRTHTTAVTANVLYNIAQKSPIGADGRRQFQPGKYFSIDRVFRNEEMDKTHLCEFHQMEGLVVDRDLSLANMMHVLQQFFHKIGIHKLRFKPAYNPYTEPSMEIFGYHDGFKKWVEVGNSGVFRPEMLRPMGFDEDVTAIAWGLSLERPTMIKYGINNIHELFGHKVDLGFIRRSPICRI
eukprot:PhM_4_TR5498/c0_g1_i1/m.5773/K01889/FARSA, pheS; phenylalanyl-tRNA synthetase alpha chain